MTKMQTMTKDAMDKAVNGLTDDQKKTWKDLTGDTFEFPAPMRGNRGRRRQSRHPRHPRHPHHHAPGAPCQVRANPPAPPIAQTYGGPRGTGAAFFAIPLPLHVAYTKPH